MCRMFLMVGKKEFSIPFNYLQYFVKNCHYGNWQVQDFQAPHSAGWGCIWLDENRLRIIRSSYPIWKSSWRELTKLRCQFFALHVRWAFPWSKNLVDTHPITLDGKNYLIHNGIISHSSFPPVTHSNYQKYNVPEELDTRKYLACILDQQIDQITDEKTRIMKIQKITKNFSKDLSANSFFITPTFIDIISEHSQPLFQKYTYVLAYNKTPDFHYISSVPFERFTDRLDRRIPNHSLLNYDFQSQQFTVHSLK